MRDQVDKKKDFLPRYIAASEDKVESHLGWGRGRKVVGGGREERRQVEKFGPWEGEEDRGCHHTGP